MDTTIPSYDLVPLKLWETNKLVQELKTLVETKQFDAPVPPEIINNDELCKRLDITLPTCIRWRNNGTIPSMQIGSAVRYNWPDVVKALSTFKGGKAGRK